MQPNVVRRLAAWDGIGWSGHRESNPGFHHGKVTGYHYIMPAIFMLVFITSEAIVWILSS